MGAPVSLAGDRLTMKLARFGDDRIGIVRDDVIVDVTDIAGGVARRMAAGRDESPDREFCRA